MAFSDLQSAILDRELCARCGACVAVCPPDVIGMTDDFLPFFTGVSDRSCDGCTLCLDVCPGHDTGVSASELRRFGRVRTDAERWVGISRGVYEVQSADERILQRASAGGAVTSLLVGALRSGLIDAALVVGHDDERPWRCRAVLTGDEALVIDSAAVKYSFAANLPLLAGTGFRRIGLVGMPCQIQAVNKMWNLPEVPDAGRRVAFTIELACASATLPEGTRYVVERRLGIDVGDVSSLRYRDGDYPGNFTVRTRDGDAHTYPFFKMVKDFTGFKTFRCDACPDWWSGLADISVADGDPNIFATSRSNTGGRPRSTVVVRSEIGEKLLAEAGAAGLLTATPGTFDPAESLGLQRKRNRYNGLARTATRPLPSPPAADPAGDRPKSDAEVIDEMSGGPA